MDTSTSSSSSLKLWNYDVFLSFRGEDTRKNFTDYLYFALKNAEVNVFIDGQLIRGESRGDDLIQVIEGSQVAVIVFSRRYAESSWCLDELAKIMDCRRTLGQIVFPIFYDVDPSDVRAQTGTFATAFLNHERRLYNVKEKLQLWRDALTEAANLSGFDVRNTDGDEAKSIMEIVAHINEVLLPSTAVGIGSRVKEISNYLNVGGSDDVRIIGIWGMGGLGKTTVAKAIFDKYHARFQGKSFLANVREKKLVDLQNTLLYDVLGSGNIKVRRVDEGTEDIKRRLSNLRVLVIVDGVDNVKQLESLAIKFNSFGSGSRIIITTRDQHLLKILKANRIYHLPAMNKEEALELLRRRAKNYYPSKEFLQVSREVVDYCGGLPLALEVLGSYLSGTSMSEWKSKLEKFKSHHSMEILNRLKISFDELADDDLKAIFLDISCFFAGMNKDYVMKILDGCDLYPEIGISVLQERCLVTTNDDFTLGMHDLLLDMGRYIVHAESPDDPGKRSRLWQHDDVIDILKNKSGTEAIQGLTLDLQESDETSFSTEAFRNMHSLRLLKLNYVKLTGSYNNLPNELRWLCWHGFPREAIPEDFDHANIVAIDLSYSKLTRVWEDSDLLLEKLKFLNLSHSHNLTRSPDFSKIPNLERLILKDCKNLQAIPALPTNLEILEADECIALEKMPDFSEMSRMRELHLNHSPKLSEILGLDKALNFNSMTSIHMEGCTNLTASFKEAILQGWSARGNGGLFLPGNEIPNNMLNVKGEDKINVGAHFVGPATTDDIHVRVKKIGINLEMEKLIKEYALDSQSMPYSSERKEEGSHKAEHSDDSSHENQSCKSLRSDPSVERNVEEETDEIMKKKREMAGALIGEAFLSASILTLCVKIGSGELMDFFREKKLDHSLLEKLKLMFLTLRVVLDDAEEKQMQNPRVGKWLEELKHAVFDAEDLLDEIDTEVLRSKVEAEFSTKKTQVWNFLSTTLNPFYQGMNGRIHTLFQRLEHLAQQKDMLSLRERVWGKLSKRTPTTSFIEHEFSIYGRDEDEMKLKTLLLSDDARGDDISIIPIVGMGGVGKTTLAQLLYNNDRVKEHFDVRAWACVSEDFDVVRVTKTLVESIASKPCDMSDMSLLQVALREQLRGKKFLFVLDDLWNENYSDWSVLQAPFTFGARGSKVIVTTRNEGVASIMHTVRIHSLKHLSDDDCWRLLAKHAFRNENASAHPDLEEIGKRIACKCNGLPLAAKTLGDLLSWNVDRRNWNHILNSNLWELPQANSILTSLRLSFHHLPSILKQCFAYCSLFPKDYGFKKDNLIRLWMAVGLISQVGGKKKMEEVGELYFNELVSRSLIQRSRNEEPEFTMHNLVNDLAMFVSREFCFRMDEEGSHEVPKRVRHFSYVKGKIDAAKKFQQLYGVKYLRTFLPMSLRDEYGDYYVSSKVLNDLLPTLKCSRAVSLARYKNISRLPDCIGNHIHLRYIDLSYTAIKRLPVTMSSLYNLQTLLLVGCYSLVELPVDMRKLIELRHLDIRDTGIKEMPMQMGRLKSLRTLTAYVLGKSTRFGGIGELGELSNLGGKLSILNLENVVDAMDALRANLKDKKDLNEIELAWGRKDADDSIKERNVLERLQPSVNLVELTIGSYGGTSFPNWLGDSSFSNIKVMRLRGFSSCWVLPPVGQLPALKELYIDNMECVMSIGAEFYGVNGTSLIQPFRSLEKLEFSGMPEWEEWLPSPGGVQCPDFPRLEELVLWSCPKLRGSLPDHLPCLKKLEVSDCGVLYERATTSRWIPWSLNRNMESLRQSLQDLKISGCPGLSSLLETESLSSLSMLDIQIFSRTDCLQPHLSSHLQKLTLHNCGSLLSFPRNGLPTTLKSLSIFDCRRLEFLSHEMMAKLTSLQHLILSDSCDSLRSFPLGVLLKLSSLYFQGSKNLESLSIGEGADDENLTHLDSLSIYYCRNLVSFPHGGLPTLNLARFMVVGCENLKLLPDQIHTLTALRDLWISGIPNVESFPEGGLPPNLQSFHISGCEKLRPSVEYWGLQRLVSLRAFQIERSEDVLEAVLKEQLLPTTLHTLEIVGMESLKSLEGKGLQHLTSLQELEIRCCDSLEFLPKEGLPASLRLLRIRYSSSLEKRCQEKTGEEWSKIAHIPCIEIGDQVII